MRNPPHTAHSLSMPSGYFSGEEHQPRQPSSLGQRDSDDCYSDQKPHPSIDESLTFIYRAAIEIAIVDDALRLELCARNGTGRHELDDGVDPEASTQTVSHGGP